MKRKLNEAYEWKIEQRTNASGGKYLIAAIDQSLSTDDTYAVRNKFRKCAVHLRYQHEQIRHEEKVTGQGRYGCGANQCGLSVAARCDFQRQLGCASNLAASRRRQFAHFT